MRRAIAGMLLCATSVTGALAQQFPPVNESPPSEARVETPAAPKPAPEVAPLATRQTSFSIPFSVDARGGTVEVQLYVSSDRGARWSMYSRQRPEAGKFLFRAADDGEYWFASRLVDAQGRGALAAGEKLAPELMVRVDTTPPKADVVAKPGSGGEIVATFQASDADLVLETVKIEFQPAGELDWQPVALDPLKIKSESGKVSGEVSWFPNTRQRAIGVRIVARDAAGNPAIVNRGVFMPSGTPAKPVTTPARTPAPLDVDPFRRDEVSTSSKPAQPWPSEGQPVPTPTSTAQPDPRTVIPTATPVVVPSESAVANRVDNASPGDVPPLLTRPPATPPTGFSPNPVAPSSPPAVVAPSASSIPTSVAPPVTPNVSPAQPVQPRVGERPDLPIGEHPRFTTKKRFKLEYDSAEVPQDQIAAVELWGTHDAGKSWLKWGADPDRQSPFEVEVEAEGVFGYRIVVVHKNGMAGLTPRSGDAADIWVGIDGVAPVAKFGNVAFGKGINAGQIDIQWSASDEWLVARPVTLSYAAAPEGPWTTIAASLANTGQFFWRVEPSVPRKVYLKLEVRDEAGNVTEDKLPEPLELEGLIPRGKIKGISPP